MFNGRILSIVIPFTHSSQSCKLCSDITLLPRPGSVSLQNLRFLSSTTECYMSLASLFFKLWILSLCKCSHSFYVIKYCSQYPVVTCWARAWDLLAITGNIILYQLIYVETSVRNKCRCSFYCTLHVSAPIGGHLQVVCNTKNSKSVTVYVSGSIASVRTNICFGDWNVSPSADGTYLDGPNGKRYSPSPDFPMDNVQNGDSYINISCLQTYRSCLIASNSTRVDF
jgi:hypothetical protein